MKLRPCWILTGLCVLLLLSACGPSGSSLDFSPASVSTSVGQSFTVALQANKINDLMAYEVHLGFDPDMLEVVFIEPGGFLEPDFIVQNDFDNAAGTLDYAAAQLGRPAVQGSGDLLKISFRARASGTTTVDFRFTPAAPDGALLADIDGRSIPVSLGKVTVRISP
jgi:hypothetical protein